MDETKSFFLQTFIFVLMNFSLYINVLRALYLCLVQIGLILEE